MPETSEFPHLRRGKSSRFGTALDRACHPSTSHVNSMRALSAIGEGGDLLWGNQKGLVSRKSTEAEDGTGPPKPEGGEMPWTRQYVANLMPPRSAQFPRELGTTLWRNPKESGKRGGSGVNSRSPERDSTVNERKKNPLADRTAKGVSSKYQGMAWDRPKVCGGPCQRGGSVLCQRSIPDWGHNSPQSER